MSKMSSLCVYLGEGLAAYNFGQDHPFGPQRHDAFRKAFERQRWSDRVQRHDPFQASQSEIEKFHTHDYVELVKKKSRLGHGFLDYGDTPAYPGVFEAASTVAGSVLHAATRMMTGEIKRAFVPIAGLHHAARDRAAGFCVFNDCGIVIEALLGDFGLERVAYVDIDAHHGDGVFYGFEDDARVIFADLHQDGRTLYPGTGFASETGRGEAQGTKLNIPMPPGANDEKFLKAWPRVEALLDEYSPQFIVLQCGADSIAGDPITAMRYSADSHSYAARRLHELAEQHCEGRMLALGGGGYNLENIAIGWTAVLEAMVDQPG